MGLQISECSTIAEYKNRIGNENGGDYIYVNKFNHSLVFSDNGTKSVMSEPVIQEDGVAWYVDLGTSDAEGSRLGTAEHPFATLAELAMFLPKNTNGHVVSLYIKAASSEQAVALNGYENLEIHSWGNSSSGNSPVISLENCKNIKVYSNDTDSASNCDFKLGEIKNSSVLIAGGTTNDGYIWLTGNDIISSDVTSVANVVVSGQISDEVNIFNIKEHSNISFMNVEASNGPVLLKVDNSEFYAESVIGHNITGLNNATININTLYRAQDTTSEQTIVSADGLTNVSVKAYAMETGVEVDEARDPVIVQASNGSRISMIAKTGEMIPVKTVTAQTGSYITLATITGYINEDDNDTVVNPVLNAHMASTIMYFSDSITENGNTHAITPVENKTTMGIINTAATADLSGYIQYNASTVSNS